MKPTFPLDPRPFLPAVVLSFALGLALAPAAAAEDEDPWPEAADEDRPDPLLAHDPSREASVHVAAILRASRKKGAPPAEALAARITERGIKVLGPLLERLDQRTVPKTGLEPDERDQILSDPQREIVLLALARLDRRPVLAALEARGVPPGPERTLVDVAVLGAVGDARELERIVALCAASPEGDPRERSAEEAGRAIERILLRSSGAFEALPRLYELACRELRPEMLKALGGARDPRFLPLLARTIELHPELEPLAVAQIVPIGRSIDRDVNLALADLLRPRIEGGLAPVSPAAILALGELGDEASVPRLIEILEEGRRDLASNAHWALRRISGQRFAERADLWKTWYEAETRWFERELGRTLADLRSSDPGRVTSAMRALAARTLRRDDVAYDLEHLLRRREAPLRALAARSLGDLGSAAAVDALIAARRDEDQKVSAAATQALEALRARGLPRDAPRWDEGENAPDATDGPTYGIALRRR